MNKKYDINNTLKDSKFLEDIKVFPKSNFLDKYFDDEQFFRTFSASMKKNIEEREEFDFNFNKDYKVPYDITSYHKALLVLNSYGCKVLDKNDLDNIEELFSALDSLIEDEMTKQIFEKLKKVLR